MDSTPTATVRLPRETIMQTFDFTAYLLPFDGDFDAVADRLHEAGCNDGTFGIREGVPHIQFSREAETLEDAIRSAIGDIRKAGLYARRIDTAETELIDRIEAELSRGDMSEERFSDLMNQGPIGELSEE